MKLFVRTHVPDIATTKHRGQTSGRISSPISKAIRKYVFLELMEVSKALQETNTSSTIKKMNVDVFIEMLTKEKDAKKEEDDSEKEEEIASDIGEENQPASE